MTTTISIGTYEDRSLRIGDPLYPDGSAAFDIIESGPSFHQNICSNINRDMAEDIISALRAVFPEQVEPKWDPGRVVVEYLDSLIGAETMLRLAEEAGATGLTIEPGTFSTFIIRRDYFVPEEYWEGVDARAAAGRAVDKAVQGTKS